MTYNFKHKHNIHLKLAVNNCFLLIIVIAFISGGLFSSCSKESMLGNTMNVVINNKTETYVATATNVTQTLEGKSFTITTITGVNASLTNLSEKKTLNLLIYAPVIEVKTYKVPAFTLDPGFKYNPQTGYALANYTNISNGKTENFLSESKSKATGSVTITNVTTSSILGTFDLVLEGSNDTTLAITGNFDAKFLTQVGSE